MTEEERAVKWSKGMPEMDALSPEEKKTVCNRAAKRLIITAFITVIIILCLFVRLSFQYPELAEYMNHISDAVNSNFDRSNTRSGRMASLITGLPVLFPLILAVLIPVPILTAALKKPLLRKETEKLFRHWRLETDSGVTGRVTSEQVKEAVDRLETGRIDYLILMPPHPILKSPFMQAAYEGGQLFILEVSKGDDIKSTVFSRSGQTKDQVLRAMKDYMVRNIIPHTDTWDIICAVGNTEKGQSAHKNHCKDRYAAPVFRPNPETERFLQERRESGEELLNHIYWMFNQKTYTLTSAFSEDVFTYTQENRMNWQPDGMAVNSAKIYVIYEAFIAGKEDLYSNEQVTDESALDEENRIDNMFRAGIAALLTADNGTYFTNGELLMKIHNQTVRKDLGSNEFFEGLERAEAWAGIPCLYVRLGS